MFSTQFWMTLLKTYVLNEMVMSSRVMAPHVQKKKKSAVPLFLGGGGETRYIEL